MAETNRVLPVLIHHESNAKPQTGGKKNQAYLRFCIEQACKYNDKVVLIGDEANKEWCREWHHVNEFKNERLDKFCKVFKNWSSYPYAWSLSIYKRFFLFEEYLKRNGYEECVVLDSDILVYLDFSRYEPFLNCDAAMEIPKAQDMETLKIPNELRWAANVGLSYFKLSALTDFLDYCTDIFENHMEDVLRPKWDAHQKYKIPGGICEMTLFYLWQKNRPEGTILNLLVPDKDGFVFSGPISGEENYLRGECRVSKVTTIKKIVYRNGYPHYVNKSDGSLLPTYSLHFIGGDKIYMEGMYRNQKPAIRAILVRWYWITRGKLGRVKRKLLKQPVG